MSGTLQPAPTASMTVASGGATVSPTTFGYYPHEGSRVITAQYSWMTQAGYAEDLSSLLARGVETTPQSAFIDNSANPSVVTLTIAGTGQVITVPANTQAVYPLFFTGAPGLQISVPAAVAGLTRIYYSNVPVDPAIWGANGTYPGSPPQLAAGGSSGPLLDAFGSLYVDTENNSPAYSAGMWFAAQINATDIMTIYGAAGKTIRIHEIIYSGNQTTELVLVRRTSQNTGGTFVPVTPAQHDATSAAAAASVGYYTANPTALGTSAGNFVTLSTISNAPPVKFDWGQFDQSIVLRGVNQGLAINLSSGNAGAMTTGLTLRWTEI